MGKAIMLLLFGLKYVYDSVNITSSNSINGQNLFLEGTTGALFCRINPWRERMSWRVDKDKVAECVGPICTKISSGLLIYDFGFNIQNSTFEFSFLVLPQIRGREITCFDGESSATVKLDVQGQGAGFRGDPKVAVLILFLSLVLTFIICVVRNWKRITKYLKGRCSPKDAERQQSTSKGDTDASGANLLNIKNVENNC